MDDAPDLAEMLRRATDARDGGARESAFGEILDLLMVYVRAAMGRGLRDRRESVDVCQSIARSLVEDVDAGKVRFESEGELRAYLRQVVRTRLAFLARGDSAQKRGGGERALDVNEPGHEPVAGGPAPSENLRAEEALGAAESVMSEADKQVAVLRARGLSWEEIASATGETAAALRQRWSRVGRKLEEGT